MKKLLWNVGIVFLFVGSLNAQVPECKLQFGTNLSGLTDYGTDLPFVNMMKNCREWYTKDPSGGFDSGQIAGMILRPDGYPTEIPQSIAGQPQRVATIWAITDGWEPGNYVVIFDGDGTLQFGGVQNFTQVNPNRYNFSFNTPVGGQIEMIIQTSNVANPVHNIRVVKTDYEATYLTNPFNPHWIEKLQQFKTVRFMDWGRTNHWGQINNWEFDVPGLVDWANRAHLDYYTWTTSKGIPYEMMIQLMNDFDFDGWVCVPHRTSDQYKIEMAQFFRDNVATDRHLYVEYSNEIWNWIFGQTQWLNELYCVSTGLGWPEGLVLPLQNNLNIWTNEYSGQLNRITRVVGSFTGWRDVTERITYPLDLSSYDAIAPTFYFGLNETGDEVLDLLGASATVADLALQVRNHMPSEFEAIVGMQEVADSVNKKMLFYEGGSHVTGIPFGETPSYCQALIDINRDTTIYNLYTEWFQQIATLQSGPDPLQCMNFSFISAPSCQYGSWGIWESLYQDTVALPPYKVYAIMNQTDCAIASVNDINENEPLKVYPNPSTDLLHIVANEPCEVKILNSFGQEIEHKTIHEKVILDLHNYPVGMYFILSSEGKVERFVKI